MQISDVLAWTLVCNPGVITCAISDLCFQLNLPLSSDLSQATGSVVASCLTHPEFALRLMSLCWLSAGRGLTCVQLTLSSEWKPETDVYSVNTSQCETLRMFEIQKRQQFRPPAPTTASPEQAVTQWGYSAVLLYVTTPAAECLISYWDYRFVLM